jgi:hypothetical protein
MTIENHLRCSNSDKKPITAYRYSETFELTVLLAVTGQVTNLDKLFYSKGIRILLPFTVRTM